MNNSLTLKYPSLYDSLLELALDLHWSWSHATDKVWKQLDPVLWELTHSPYVVLQTSSHQRINSVLDDPIVRDLVEDLIQDKKQRALAPGWFQQSHPDVALNGIAYFSMEFMLSESLPIYSGGLGNVAGDHLKSASDLGLPLIGVGLLYQQGYSRQVINEDGSQNYLFPYNDPGQLPISPLRNKNGEWLRIELKLPGYSLWLRSWKVQVGRLMLLLLDSNDAANIPRHRGITSELYGGDKELRLAQELVLGIGGWRLLQAIDFHPEVIHLNEGHSAFAILERAAHFMDQNGQNFEDALASTRAGNIFTTHTGVAAGFDCFSARFIEEYMGTYAQERLKISMHDFLALGRVNPDDPSECFNLANLAIKGCGQINGVSKVHQQVSKGLFAPLFQRWPFAEIPVGVVTNGVHMPTWDSAEADRFWTETCGKNRWLGSLSTLEQNIRCVPDERIWAMRCDSKKTLIDHIHLRYSRQLALNGRSQAEIGNAGRIFNSEVLTLGFARRFTEYKRPNLLLNDPDRLHRLLTHTDRPVQLVIAGKPHPQDMPGQAMVQEWIKFIDQRGLSSKVIFLSDYDMQLNEELVQGVDVWLNTPRSPWEACGTSGMKVLVNGGLNLSVLDGWWNEAYESDIGWAIDNRYDIPNVSDRDKAEAQQMYRLLEEDIIPEFYNRNERGIPASWVKRIRESMARLTTRFSANRSVREYTENYYLPAVAGYRKRAGDSGRTGQRIANWKRELEEKWKRLHFINSFIEYIQGSYRFTVKVFIGDLPTKDICIELYANADHGANIFKQEMTEYVSLGEGVFSFSLIVAATRPATDFTVRIIPVNESLAIPLECSLILWEH